MQAHVGSTVYVDSRVLGRPPRSGHILEILGSEGNLHYRVHWDDGRESYYYPGPDGHVLETSEAFTGDEGAGHRRVLRLRGTVGELMTDAPRIDAGSTLREVATALAGSTTGAVAVFDGDEMAGIVTGNDIVRSLAAGADADEVWAADVMPPNTIFGTPEDSIVQAADTMANAGIHHLPLRSGGRVVGLVGAPDLLAAVLGT